MTDTYTALVKKGRRDGSGRVNCTFEVEAPPDLPKMFTTTLSSDEATQIERSTESEIPVGGLGGRRIPVRYANGWEIAWDEL